jgi:hypothetical protein
MKAQTRMNSPLFPGDLRPTASGYSRVRDSVADSLFHISRAFPKLLALRSTPSAWTLLRVLLGTIGAGMVVLPLSLWNGWAFAPAGLVLFLLAVLLPPIPKAHSTAKAIEQLGAYLVLDGGRVPGEAGAPSVNFYLTPTRVWALDQELRPVVVIPANEITLVEAFPAEGDWVLRVGWQSNSAEFLFAGLFAERRARLAAEGLDHLVHATDSSFGKGRKARAAGA